MLALNTPTAVALDDEGVSWVVLHDEDALVRVHVDMGDDGTLGYRHHEK